MNGQQKVIFYAIIAILLVFIAGYAPKLVNGLLILVLVGLVLKQSGAIDKFIAGGVAVAQSSQGK